MFLKSKLQLIDYQLVIKTYRTIVFIKVPQYLQRLALKFRDIH